MNTHLSRRAAGIVVLGLVALGLSGCATSSATAPTGQIQVVASTNAWGSIAEAIGGDSVNVTSLITDPNQDPHDFQSSANNLQTVSNAQLILENGGGYDDFMDQLIDTANTKAPVLNAVELSGMTVGDGFNEHVWYSLPTAEKVAEQIASQLSVIDPSNAQKYSTNLQEFETQLNQLIAKQASMAEVNDGKEVAVTEPVPLYLLIDAGLSNATPEEFSEAIEQGTDAPPAVLEQMKQLLSARTVALLAVNAQTTGPQTDAVVAAAQAAGVPVVDFTETLPTGLDYLSWMTQNLNNVSSALAQ